jgi:uncharacterized protein (TIGR02147 family)
MAINSSASPSASAEYRRVLSDELARRISTNSRYSLRSFASSLGVSPAFLSKVLRSQKSLSLEKAACISEALGLTETETEQFCSSVRGRSAGAAVLRVEETHPVSELGLDAFELISDWYHYAIRELTDCRNFNPAPEAVAARLGISAQDARHAMQRMLRLGVLKEVRGRITKAKAYVATPSGTANKALRAFHKQMLEKAISALESQEPSERDISGVTLAIHPEKIEEAKEEIRRFRRRMARFLDTGRPTSVYQLNVQFFRLSKEKKT